MKIIESEEWMENPSIYNKILGYPRIMRNNKILLTKFRSNYLEYFIIFIGEGKGI